MDAPTRGQPLLVDVAPQVAENTAANREIGQIGDDGGERHHQRQAPVPWPPEHRQGQQRSWLDQCAKRDGDARKQGAAVQEEQQAHHQQRAHGRIHVAVTGDLPDGQRVPGVSSNARGRDALAIENRQQRGHDRCFESDEAELHDQHAFSKTRDREKDGLGRWRVDGDGVAGAIDIGVDRRIAQMRDLRGARHVAIRIDAGGLHAAIPNVAIDVGRQIRLDKHESQPHRHGADEDHDQRSPLIGAVHPRRQNGACGADAEDEHQRPAAVGQMQRGTCCSEANKANPDRSKAHVRPSRLDQRVGVGGHATRLEGILPPSRPARSAPSSSRPSSLRVHEAVVALLPQARNGRASNSSPTSTRNASASSTSYQEGR